MKDRFDGNERNEELAKLLLQAQSEKLAASSKQLYHQAKANAAAKEVALWAEMVGYLTGLMEDEEPP